MGIDSVLAQRVGRKRCERLSALFNLLTGCQVRKHLQTARPHVSMGLVTNTWGKFVDAIDDRLHCDNISPLLLTEKPRKDGTSQILLGYRWL